MSADGQNGLTRRAALQRGAAVSGLVWVTPVVKAVRIVQAAGTPPPPQTTTGPPSVTTYTLNGAFDTPLLFPIDPTCVGIPVSIEFGINIEGVGPATVALPGCAVQQ